VYRDGVYKLSCNCACESARRGVRRYIELSTALMLSADKVAAAAAAATGHEIGWEEHL